MDFSAKFFNGRSFRCVFTCFRQIVQNRNNTNSNAAFWDEKSGINAKVTNDKNNYSEVFMLCSFSDVAKHFALSVKKKTEHV